MVCHKEQVELGVTCMLLALESVPSDPFTSRLHKEEVKGLVSTYLHQQISQRSLVETRPSGEPDPQSSAPRSLEAPPRAWCSLGAQGATPAWQNKELCFRECRRPRVKHPGQRSELADRRPFISATSLAQPVLPASHLFPSTWRSDCPIPPSHYSQETTTVSHSTLTHSPPAPIDLHTGGHSSPLFTDAGN